MVDDPRLVTSKQMDRWARDFDSWDLCDQVCSNLFSRTRQAHGKALSWSRRRAEFIKRAGFTLMAALAVHDESAPNTAFEKFLRAIRHEATDDRNYVKKAVNWALRQIGKRNRRLNKSAIRLAREIQQSSSRSARWIAADALRELTSAAVQRRPRQASLDRP
jgi:3-methyladenine DNA glycosylase AlkD